MMGMLFQQELKKQLIYLSWLGLHCYTRVFSSRSEPGLCFVVMCGPLWSFSCCGAEALGCSGFSASGRWTLGHGLSWLWYIGLVSARTFRSGFNFILKSSK